MENYKTQLDNVLKDFLLTVEFKKGNNPIENALNLLNREKLMETLASKLNIKCNEISSLDKSVPGDDLIEYAQSLVVKYLEMIQ